MTPELTALLCVAATLLVVWDFSRRWFARDHLSQFQILQKQIRDVGQDISDRNVPLAAMQASVAKLQDDAKRTADSLLSIREKHRADLDQLAQMFSARCDMHKDALGDLEMRSMVVTDGLRADLTAHDKVHAAMVADWQQVITELNRRIDKVVEEATSKVAGTLALAEEGKSKWR